MAFQHLPKLIKKSLRSLREEGAASLLGRVRKYLVYHYSIEQFLGYRKLRAYQLKKQGLWYSVSGKAVAIVIPSYNDTKVLKACLESLQKTIVPGRARIIVSDDASTDAEHRSFLQTIADPNVRVLFSRQNGGFSKAANAGLREALKLQCDVVLLNSDIEAREGWLAGLQFAAYQDDAIGIAGPKLLYPDGTIQSAGSHRNDKAPEWFDHYYRFKPSHFGPANVPGYRIAMTGAALYFKREVLERIGLFDERYGMGFEDVDLCLRAWQAGFRVGYAPFSELVHHESVTRGRVVGERESSSLAYFWEKWGDFFDRREVREPAGKSEGGIRKIRVIYALEDTNIGGGHRIVFEHLNRLQQSGEFSCELYALADKPEWFPLSVPVRTFLDYEQMATALAEQDAIKVATWWRTSKPVWVGSLLKGIPVFFVQDIEKSYYANHRQLQETVLASYRREFHCLTTSVWNQEQLKEFHLNATIVPCGIDTSVFRALEGDARILREERILLTAGRINPLKNCALTIDAWKLLRDSEHPELCPELWMYGVEPEVAEGLKGAKYIFRPSDEEINVLLNRAQAFILTSKHEGFALTLLEAMAAGAVVITTDADGNRDFCVDGVNCVMVGHDPASVAEGIRRVFSDSSLRERLRQGGYQTAARYSWERVTPQLADYFRNLAEVRVAPAVSSSGSLSVKSKRPARRDIACP